MKAFDGTAKLVRRRCPFNLTGDIQDLSCFRAGADRRATGSLFRSCIGRRRSRVDGADMVCPSGKDRRPT